MVEIHHLRNREIAISQLKPSDFDEIRYTAAHLVLANSHVIRIKCEDF